jgi:uncharacterized protein
LLRCKTYNLTTGVADAAGGRRVRHSAPDAAADMKLQADRIDGQNAISRHGPEGIIVNGVERRRSVVVPWAGPVTLWQVHAFDALAVEHFASLAALAPELVIFGSGGRLRFVRPSLLRPLIERRIGVETMDTAAACRTYNVLIAEGRSVVAALLFEAAQPGASAP